MCSFMCSCCIMYYHSSFSNVLHHLTWKLEDSPLLLHRSQDITLWAHIGQMGTCYSFYCTTSCHFISPVLFHYGTQEKTLTVFVNCITAATVNMSGLSSQAVMLINISLLNRNFGYIFKQLFFNQTEVWDEVICEKLHWIDFFFSSS